MIKQRAPLNWLIGGEVGGKAGRTSKQKDGSVLIEISRRALLDPKLLYHTIGHELIHAADLTNGNYEKWVKAVSGDGWTGADLNHLVHTMMEHHAYMWDAATEIKFGTDYGAQTMLGLTTSTLEPWGYLSLFNK